MRIHLNKIFRIMLPLVALLIGCAAARAQNEEGAVYSLTTRCVPVEAGTTHPTSSKYEAGTSIAINFNYTYTSYHFIHWEDESGTVVSTEGAFNYTMPDHDVALIALFEYDPASPTEPSVPKPMATVHLDISPAESGYVYADVGYVRESSDLRYEVGSTATLSAYSNSGFSFVNWTENGVEVSTSTDLSFTVEEEGHSITANFAYDPSSPSEPAEMVFYRKLSLKANPEEAAYSFSGAGEYVEGSSEEVSVSANEYYVFDNWTDDSGNVVSTERSFEYTMPGRNVTLTANFHYDYNPTDPDDPGTPSIDDQGIVGKPRMTMQDSTHVLILCSTSGATIHYTIDGTEPTIENSIYTEPVFVPGNIIVKAIAVKEGMTNSAVSTYQVKSYTVEMPVIAFDHGKIKMTSATPGATIRYTTDDSDPTAVSQAYSEPLDLQTDLDAEVLVKAFAMKEGMTDSDIAVYVFMRGEHVMEAPAFSLDADGKLVITPSVEDGFTHYTLDGTNPVSTSPIYTEPITLTHNGTVKAYTTHVDYYDSPVGEYIVEGFKVETPTCAYSDLALSFAVDTEGAEIRYTVDGSVPTETSTLYSEPLRLTEDCKVVARGFKANYEPSDTISYTFVYADHQVAMPAFAYDSQTSMLTLSCPTENAEIRYTTDGSEPTATTGTKYEAPIKLEGNATYKARAFRSDLYDSETASLAISGQKVYAPTATFSNRQLILECSDAEAVIVYTTDGSTPTEASTAYTAPIPLTEDCTVNFMAVREGFNNSDVANYVFTLADWQEKKPEEFTFDYLNRRMAVLSDDDISFRIVAGDVDRVVKPGEDIVVEPSMASMSVTALASNEDRYDSETNNLELVFHLPPTLTYDGHELGVTPSADDPSPSGIECSLFFDGKLVANASQMQVKISRFCDVLAIAKSDNAFASDSVSMRIDAFNTGRLAAARNGHRLSEVFGTWGDTLSDYTYLHVDGEVEKEDLELLGSLPNLTTLHLEPYHTTTVACDGVLAGSRIETLFAVNIPEGLLKGMPRLTTVMWGITNERMPDGRLTEAANPNILLWVTDDAMAPADAVNIVTYPYVGGGVPTDPDGEGVEGTAEKITLQAGYPFGAHMPVEVESIELTKEFSLPTPIGDCGGWESIVLPFDARSILSEQSGELVPFLTWYEQDDVRPFWLYGATEGGWEAQTAMKAYVPYLISMPNNYEYSDDYIITGKVTFSGSKVRLAPDTSIPKSSTWLDGIEFKGTFMPVEETGIRALNLKDAAGYDYLGSAFVADGEVLPFGAYIKGHGLPERIPVFGDWSGVLTPEADTVGLIVDTPAPGTIRVIGSRECRTAIVTPDGAVIRVIDLREGESVTVEGLTRGLYMCGGVKVMVR